MHQVLTVNMQMRFMSFDEALNVIQVVIMDFDYDVMARNLNNDMQREVGTGDGTAGDCRLDIMGDFTHPNGCHNEGYDELESDIYCIDKRVMELSQRKTNEEWLPSILEFYWQSGIDDKGLEFLKSNHFVVSYE